MTYESLLNDLQTAYTWFYGIFRQFLNFVSDKPVLMLGLYVSIALPFLILLFDFFVKLAESTDDFTTDSIRIYKYFRSGKFSKKAKEMRMNFHKLKHTFKRNNDESVSEKELNDALAKWDNIPLKIPYNHQKVYNQPVISSSAFPQRSRANIDVEVDDD